MGNKQFTGNFTLGILGGGQLGRMLIQKCVDFGINVHILDPDTEAPCKYLCSDFTQGNLQDYDTVMAFGKKVDLLTIEIEKVNTQALADLQAQGIEVYPQPHLIQLIQDKGLQKQFFVDNNIPTAPFALVSDGSETGGFTYPYILKLRKDGYDGKGVMKIKDAEGLKQAFNAPCIVEQMADIATEIAVIVGRNNKGETAVFPTVQMDFHPEANLVEFLSAPAELDAATEVKAKEIAIQVAEKLGIVGILAVELFVNKDGSIWVNELAPRPHNSGHHTIEANVTSQYEQHLRCILGLKPGNTDTVFHAAMVNILGSEGHSGEAHYQGMHDVLATEGAFVHLYGKKDTKPFRKMGHVTVIGSSHAQVKEKAQFVKDTLKVVSK